MTGVFGRWFQRARPVEDRVWIDAGVCRRGLRAEVARALEQGADDAITSPLLTRAIERAQRP